jgi:hypothetical protein
MVKVTCVAVITGGTRVPAEAIPAELTTVPTTSAVARNNVNRRMYIPFEANEIAP